MAVGAGVVGECRATATASNVNAGLFNPQNANMLTDGAATSATGNSPVFTSASYSFVANDVGHWVYIKLGTNWIPGWYKIVSVSAGAATLNATIGSAVLISNAIIYGANIAAGIATTASPTGATWTMDYTQSDTAFITDTDLVLATTTTMTSTANPFGPQMAGNYIHVTAGTGFTVGWYEIVSISSVTATLDRAAGTALSSSGTGRVGGAFSLGASSDSTVFALPGAATSTLAAHFFIKNGTFALGASPTMTAGTTTMPCIAEGYNSNRGDRPKDSSRPIFAGGASFSGIICATAGYNTIKNMQFTASGSSAPISTSNAPGIRISECKTTNLSTTRNRASISVTLNCSTAAGGANCIINDCEITSYRGQGVGIIGNNTTPTQNVGGVIVHGCYIHDCEQAIVLANSGNFTASNNIIGPVASNSGFTNPSIGFGAAFSGNVTSQINFFNNTFYGAEDNTGMGPAIRATASTVLTAMYLRNNIFYGFSASSNSLPVIMTNNAGSASAQIAGDNNVFFNNGFNNGDYTTGYIPGASDLTSVNPTFSNVVARSGATATTTSGNHLVQSGATFQTWGITPGRDFLVITGGTGATILGIYGIASVDSETQITTDVALTANATADKTWYIISGRNFAVGTNMKGAGAPAAFPAGFTTAYVDIGGVQRQESGGGGSGIAKRAGDGGGYAG